MNGTTGRLPLLLLTGLVVIWLLLNQTLALWHIVAGAALAGALASLSAPFRPPSSRPRKLYLGALLLALAFWDIVRSNAGVGRIVWGLVRDREVKSGFVRIPLDLRAASGLAVLATIITSTPGTVWVDLTPDGRWLTLHVLDLRDEAEWISWIKNRYEPHLREMFE